MAEELKELIEKIQAEGILAAEKKAAGIESQAKHEAAAILQSAKKEAEHLMADAKDAISRMEKGSRESLKQVARDLLLSLKKEINAMLDRIVVSHVHKALTAEELAKIITALVKDHRKSGDENIIISLKKEDLEKLEKGFLSDLKDEIKKGVVLKSSDDIQGGLLISYDSGKSYYDFTDKALARYISFQLKPKLAEILNETA